MIGDLEVYGSAPWQHRHRRRITEMPDRQVMRVDLTVFRGERLEQLLPRHRRQEHADVHGVTGGRVLLDGLELDVVLRVLGEVIHGYLTGLPTSKRRTLFYILAGPDLRTLYDLEALSLSANLVINDENINQLQAILRKSFREYEELFGPLIEAMSAYEKQ